MTYHLSLPCGLGEHDRCGDVGCDCTWPRRREGGMIPMTYTKFALQMAVWGWSDSGDRGFSPGCIAAELRHRAVANGRPVWDDPERLRNVTILEPDGSRHDPPEWHALPWVTEHLARAEVAA